MEKNKSVEYTIELRVPDGASGSVTNTATIDFDGRDTDPMNNSASEDTTIEPKITDTVLPRVLRVDNAMSLDEDRPIEQCENEADPPAHLLVRFNEVMNNPAG